MVKCGFLRFLLIVSALGTLPAQNQPIPGKSNQVVLKYLGTAGWEITDGTTTILIDPYLSRINGPAPPRGGSGHLLAGDTRPAYGWGDVAQPDVAAIDSHIQRADFVLVTHTHYDHILDVPHIALKTRAAVIGTESTENVMRAYAIPEQQLITVRGGEDYQFSSFSLKVIPSIHSPLDHKHYFSSATALAGMKAPLTLEQIHPEGGTLAYLIRFHGHQILAFGGDELRRTRDRRTGSGRRTGRSRRFPKGNLPLQRPPYARSSLSSHSPPDSLGHFLAPYGASQQPALEALQSFVQEIVAASPKTKVIVPKYFEAIPLETAAK
jgi:L-ascorbate metabolism protein UlaG (beta-lactamase superfamily)